MLSQLADPSCSISVELPTTSRFIALACFRENFARNGRIWESPVAAARLKTEQSLPERFLIGHPLALSADQSPALGLATIEV